MDLSGATGTANGAPKAVARLSYKFQRLREKLRHAIETGELQGKLPGERQLARRFRVNAKTLSKALTDLAAEGLLDRSIGRGTFVRSAAAPAATAAEKWLIVCDPEQTAARIVGLIQQANANTQVVTDTRTLRPSFLNQFKAVINFSWKTPDAFVRSLVVRNLTVILVNREPGVYSVNAVLVDRALAASCLARDMILAGHRRFLAVEKQGQTAIADAIRNAARRYDPGATVDSADPSDLPEGIESGVTAVVCGTFPLAEESRNVLVGAGIDVPGRVSLAAVGAGVGEYPCSGYWTHAAQKADAILQILRDPQVRRPTTIWLRGEYIDLGTTSPPNTMPVAARPDALADYKQLTA